MSKKPYEVWLAKDGGRWFPSGFTFTADVQANSLRDAVNAYNRQSASVSPATRQIAKGDVVVDPKGRWHRVTGQGFEELTPSNNTPPLEKPARRAQFQKKQSRDIER